LQFTRSIIHHAKHLSALFATLLISGYGMVATAETLSTELSQVPETVLPTALPDAIEIEGDKLDMYLDRKMRASGNAVISKGDQKIYGDTIEYDEQNDELQVNGNARIELRDGLIKGPALKMRLSESIGEMNDASITLNKDLNSIKPQSTPYNNPSAYTRSKLLNTQTSLTDDPRLYRDNYNEPTAQTDQLSIDPKFNSSRGDAKTILFEGQDKKRLLNARYTTCEAGVM
jgi:LPS-assembly protein